MTRCTYVLPPPGGRRRSGPMPMAHGTAHSNLPTAPKRSQVPVLANETMVDLLPDNVEAIQAFLREKGWIGSTTTVSSLAPAGEGNMNRTLRATLDNTAEGSPVTLILKQSVPFVAKYPQIAAPQDRLDVEASFYGIAAASADVQRYMPKMLHYDSESNIMCLEDLGDGADMTAGYSRTSDVFNAQDRQALMKWLESLHCIELDNSGKRDAFANMEMRKLNATHIFDLPLAKDNGIDLDGFTSGLQKVAADEYVGNANLIDQSKRLHDIYIGKTNSNAGTYCLLHGDFYPGSFLSVSTVMIIDPEFAFWGPAEFDLGVFAAHCRFCGISLEEIDTAFSSYGRPFDRQLALAFAGIELIRRLLGVAQLPLPADTTLEMKEEWLKQGREWLMNWN